MNKYRICRDFALLFIIPVLFDLVNKNYSSASKISELKTETFEIGRHETLDQDFHLRWWLDFQNETILFEVQVKTKGWLSFGIANNEKFTKADVIVGGIFENGTAYFSDRHATHPGADYKLDRVQNWDLHSATEEGEWITLKFSRHLNTCDEEEDVIISEDTCMILWAIGQKDSVDGNVTRLTRGTHFANFLDPPSYMAQKSRFTMWSLETLSQVPTTKPTSWWCSVHASPEFKKKNHIVGFEAIVDSPEAQKYSHHIILRRCVPPRGKEKSWPELEKLVGQRGGECYDPEIERAFERCYEYYYIWGKGGGSFLLPDHVGLPVGQIGSKEYFVVESHYSNPDLTDITQYKTGFRIFYTDYLREHDAGILSVHHDANPSITIPPAVKDWTVSTHCSPYCTQKAVEKIKDTKKHKKKKQKKSISLFNVLMHTHLAGRKMKLRHFRKNEELPWISSDDNYVFHFQRNRPLRREVQVRPGDQITLGMTMLANLHLIISYSNSKK